MRTLVIDNIDSFVYNLVQYVGVQGGEPVVLDNRTSKDEVDDAVAGVDRIIISPGPKRPEDAGISNYVIQEYGPDIPLLGVCLGHQCIGHVFGAEVRHAKTLMHGKTSRIMHDGSVLFEGVGNPFEATRYHSLVVDGLPDCLVKTADSMDDGEIMGLRHRDYPVYGVQFHPESIMTAEGMRIIENFLSKEVEL
ncbi:MAG: aminodeoxychorismate/anthranilate synthase component II [Candidatus Altiarchaeota archaeon]